MFNSGKITELEHKIREQEARIAELEKERDFYRGIAEVDHEEMKVVIRDGAMVFKSKKAQNTDEQQLLSELRKNDDYIVLDDCEGTVVRNMVGRDHVYIVKKMDVRKGGSQKLLHMHQDTIRSAFKSTQNLFIDLLDELDGMVKESKETAQGSVEGLSYITQVADTSDKLHQHMNSATEVAANLSEKSNSIQNVITLIEDIADQTNLLALNAAIEAARAGEHGRGFAVVADEVRNLAERTQKATQEITMVVKQMQQETSDIETSTHETNLLVEETNENVRILKELVERFQKNASRSVYKVMNIGNLIFVNLAKTDHIIYKNNVYALIFGEEDHGFNPVDHHSCRLGKWYDQGIGKEQFGKMPSYGKLEAPHALVHDEANQLAQECGGSDIVCSIAEIEHRINRIEDGSKGVFAALDAIVVEKKESMMKAAIDDLFSNTDVLKKG